MSKGAPSGLPAVGEVAVEVHPVRVLAGAGGVAVGVQVRRSARARCRAAAATRSRRAAIVAAGGLVAVDRADHEQLHARPRAAHPHRPDRPAPRTLRPRSTRPGCATRRGRQRAVAGRRPPSRVSSAQTAAARSERISVMAAGRTAPSMPALRPCPARRSAGAVDSRTVIADLAARASSGRRLAIDTEFVSERRYRALLCLVQVAVPDPEGPDGVRTEVIDPLADGFDPESTANRWRRCWPIPDGGGGGARRAPGRGDPAARVAHGGAQRLRHAGGRRVPRASAARRATSRWCARCSARA